MAAKKKAEKEELEKFGECKSVVANTEKAVQCELCNLWFHCFVTSAAIEMDFVLL